MKLCRTIMLAGDRKINHAVYPVREIENLPALVIAGPQKLSFEPFRLAALIDAEEILEPDFIFADEMRVSWSVLISDQLDEQPLFATDSGARALLLISEIINALFEGFTSFDHRLISVTPNMLTKHLVLEYEIASQTTAHEALGAALCFATMLDSLLFVRGLQVSAASLFLVDEWKLKRDDFVSLYRHVLTERHGY